MVTVSNNRNLKLTGSVMLCCSWQTQTIAGQRNVRLTVSVTLCCRCGKKKRTKSLRTRAQHSFSVGKVVRTTVAHAMRQKGCRNHPSKEQTFIVVNECKPMDALLLVMVSTQMIKLQQNSLENCFRFTPLLFCESESRYVFEDSLGHAILHELRLDSDTSLLDTLSSQLAAFQHIMQCNIHEFA